jgi:tRNA G18 (ribose-2'-O)-methylase SpoU
VVVAATTPDASATDLADFVTTPDARGGVAILLGTEGHGLADHAIARADVRVRIPTTGGLDSLNIATAAGITLHRLHEARRPRAEIGRHT